MKTCKSCYFWTPTTNYDYKDAVNDGICSELNGEIHIQIRAGWNGGYVDYIETQDTFGCILHKTK